MSSDDAREEVGLLSVVIPIRDDGRHVAALLRHWDSMLVSGPAMGDVSFVLVDESASAEPVAGLATSLAQAGFSARIHRQEPARGPGHARMLGLNLVTSEFVCFLDVDDRPDLKQFVAAAQIARQRDLDVVSVDYVVEVDGRIVERGVQPRRGHFWDDLLSRRLGIWRFVLRVDFLRGSGISFPEWDYAEDLAFLLQCANRASRTDHVPVVAYTYVLHNQGLSGRRPTGTQVDRAIKWLSRPGPPNETVAGRYLRALWLARIAILGGWRTAPRILPAVPHLARDPLRVVEIAGRAVQSRYVRRSSQALGER